MILTIRTDKPESEIGLLDQSDKELAYEKWSAHRALSDTIHKKIDTQLSKLNKTMADITGVVVYQGPGSFTGLRIGMSVANALAYSLGVPVVAAKGSNWIQIGGEILKNAKLNKYVTPVYGASANITKPKK